jgi:hypothetical protein
LTTVCHNRAGFYDTAEPIDEVVENRSRRDPVVLFDRAYPGSADQFLARLAPRPKGNGWNCERTEGQKIAANPNGFCWRRGFRNPGMRTSRDGENNGAPRSDDRLTRRRTYTGKTTPDRRDIRPVVDECIGHRWGLRGFPGVQQVSRAEITRFKENADK